MPAQCGGLRKVSSVAGIEAGNQVPAHRMQCPKSCWAEQLRLGALPRGCQSLAFTGCPARGLLVSSELGPYGQVPRRPAPRELLAISWQLGTSEAPQGLADWGGARP